MKKRKTLIGSLLVTALFLLSAMIGMLTTASGEEDFKNTFIEKETGTTELFGGGDYVAIKFGSDAWFAVIYGTEDNPNSIIIASVATRYLGAAEVYDGSGGKISTQIPIRIKNVFAMKLRHIFEFNDTNDDGLCNYRKKGDGLTYKDYVMHEPIYKAVNLSTVWERSEVTVTSNETGKSWEFTLTAIDLPYVPIGEVSGEGKLEKVVFTIKLSASLKDVERGVPFYKIELRRNEDAVDRVIEKGNRTYKGKTIVYSTKMDHYFEGWDFEENNTNPHLLLETHAFVGNVVPSEVAKKWRWLTYNVAKEKIRGTVRAKVEYSGENQSEEMDEDNAKAGWYINKAPKRLKHQRIKLETQWEKVGWLTWVTNVTVTRNGTETEKNMYFQVQGHRKLWGFGIEKKTVYRGFVILGGFSYPWGDTIYHDPSVGSEVTLLDISEIGIEEDSEWMPGFELLALIPAAAAAVVVFGRRKR